MNHLLNSLHDLTVLIEEHEIESTPPTTSFPCVAVVEGNQCVAIVSIDDFYPDAETTVSNVYKSLEWHESSFDVRDTTPENLEKLCRCQAFLTARLTDVAALKGQSQALKVDLEHKRMRRRAAIKMSERAKGETGQDAEATARIQSEEIDMLHVAAVRSAEEMYGLWERTRSTLMAIAQDRKSLQHALERFMALS